MRLIILIPSLLFAVLLNGQNNHSTLVKADQLYKKKDYTRAEDLYKQAGKSALYNAGTAAYQHNDWEASEAALKEVAEAPGTPQAKANALYNLGNAYMRQSKWIEAVAAYEKSLSLLPNQPDAKKNLQIAKKQQQTPPPPPPPTPPPPPRSAPRQNYVDQPRGPRAPEQPSGTMDAAKAKYILENKVVPDEERYARQYRSLQPNPRASRTRKDW